MEMGKIHGRLLLGFAPSAKAAEDRHIANALLAICPANFGVEGCVFLASPI
jgi:hypothetical protein